MDSCQLALINTNNEPSHFEVILGQAYQYVELTHL